MLPLLPLAMVAKLIGLAILVSIELNYLVIFIVTYFWLKPIAIVPRLVNPFIYFVSWPTLDEKRYFSPLIVPIAVSFLDAIPFLYFPVFINP